jgi:hypothetical protein
MQLRSHAGLNPLLPAVQQTLCCAKPTPQAISPAPLHNATPSLSSSPPEMLTSTASTTTGKVCQHRGDIHTAHISATAPPHPIEPGETQAGPSTGSHTALPAALLCLPTMQCSSSAAGCMQPCRSSAKVNVAPILTHNSLQHRELRQMLTPCMAYTPCATSLTTAPLKQHASFPAPLHPHH